VSEHQYYEFRAVDRSLTERELKELRALSTRATITPTSFVNVYHWGDFRGDPRKLMRKYFDAFLYVANWGTHWLMLRLPRGLIDAETASAYGAGDSFSVETTPDHVVLDFHSESEDGEWVEGEDEWLPELLPVREEIFAGDLRALYLGWLVGVQSGDLEDDDPVPPVPPGLANRTAALNKLAEFLRIDDDLLAAAAAASVGAAPAVPTAEELAAWVAALPGSEKEAMLLRVAEGGAPHLRGEIVQRVLRERGAVAPAPGGRTVGELRAAWEGRAEEERRREEKRKAEAAARRAGKEAEERARRLDALAARGEAAWGEVEKLVATKKPAEYDQAAARLTDLLALAERDGRPDEAAARIRRLREQHARKPSFLARLDKAGVPK
jgi:hypothetical protein